MEKLNIAELLKDCPIGMELDSTIVDGLYFGEVTEHNMIKCYTKQYCESTCTCNTIYFHHDGTYLTTQNAKCVIFPKGKTTWEGFQRPFKDGDVVVCKDGKMAQMFILKFQVNDNRGYCYTGYDFHINRFFEKGYWDFHRLATKEEKQKLFDAIKANGYKWNAETKTLEKLKVSKFDFTTLKPFDKVLVRQNNYDNWHISFFEKYHASLDKYPFVSMHYNKHKQCIPYEGNEHLLGTTNECDEYYKTWE